MVSSPRSMEDRGSPKTEAGGSTPPENAILVQVTAPHFCASLVLVDDTCTEAAPILKYAIGKRREWLRDYFRQKGWKAVVVNTEGWQRG